MTLPRIETYGLDDYLEKRRRWELDAFELAGKLVNVASAFALAVSGRRESRVEGLRDSLSKLYCDIDNLVDRMPRYEHD